MNYIDIGNPAYEKTIECPYCEGKGEIYTPNWYVNCPTCGGCGDLKMAPSVEQDKRDDYKEMLND